MSDGSTFATHLPVLPQAEPYPERTSIRRSKLDQGFRRVLSHGVAAMAGLRTRQLRAIVDPTHRATVGLAGLGDAVLQDRARLLASRLKRTEAVSAEGLGPLFAVVREASSRILGLRHHDVQLMGAFALVQGMVAEMNTGEGKSLTATLAAVTMALRGRAVHVITVNDYLAQRDAEKFAPLYAFFGLQTGVIYEGLSKEDRRAAYRAHVVYAANKEIAFDYLKDRLVLSSAGGPLRRKLRAVEGLSETDQRPIMRGLDFSIVDEADSVLVDEARTPLILSGAADSAVEADSLRQALVVAHHLRSGQHFRLDPTAGRVALTTDGQAILERVSAILGGDWRSAIYREDAVTKALTALHVMQRDSHYIIQDSKIAIVDEYSGRIMADRFWSDGLHQLVELKEGTAPSPQRVTMARMTYQRLFRRYRLLSGMTGTAREISAELWEVYDLKVARIPTHRPSRRRVLPDVVLPTADMRWQATARLTRALAARGVPVLIGTRSVKASLEASEALHRLRVPHRVLNAVDEKAESDIVAGAGEAGRVTVATNMAGRGTDIVLGPGVAERGGLHVIMTERHEAGRIDRQLAGRCARQGDPGCVIVMLSMEDSLLQDAGLPRRVALANRLLRSGWAMPARRLIMACQRLAETRHARIRRDLLRSDEDMDFALAFAGAPE